MTTAKAIGYVRCSVEGCRKKAGVQGKCKNHAEQKAPQVVAESALNDAALSDAKKETLGANALLQELKAKHNAPVQALSAGTDEVKGLEKAISKDRRNDTVAKATAHKALGTVDQGRKPKKTFSGSMSSRLASLFFGIGMKAGKISRLFDK